MTYKIYLGVLLAIVGAVFFGLLLHTNGWWTICIVLFYAGCVCLFNGLRELRDELNDIKMKFMQLEELEEK